MSTLLNRLPSLADAKTQARHLRAELENTSSPISHSRSLEMISHQWGYKDWNTFHSAIGNRPDETPFTLGAAVRGRYLGQDFTGKIIGLQLLGGGSRYRVSLDLDEPVDVVKFDSFSSMRRRINGTVDVQGQSFEKTSDGKPQLSIRL